MAPPFICDGEEQRSWSAEEWRWCCDREPVLCQAAELGTTSSTPVPYDCLQGLSSWRIRWSGEKKAWCCEFEGRACPPLVSLPQAQATTTRWGFDCAAASPSVVEAWVPAKRIFCCLEKGIACNTFHQERTTCFTKGLAFQRNSGAELPMTAEANASQCQVRCFQTRSCKHFTFWSADRRCYLYDAGVIELRLEKGGNSNEFVSGPAICGQGSLHSPGFTDASTSTSTATNTTTSTATDTSTLSATGTATTTTAAAVVVTAGGSLDLNQVLARPGLQPSAEPPSTSTASTSASPRVAPTSTVWVIAGSLPGFPELQNKFLGPQAEHATDRARALPVLSIACIALAVCGIACSTLGFGACRHTSRSGVLLATDADEVGHLCAASKLQQLQQLWGGRAPTSAREYQALHRCDQSSDAAAVVVAEVSGDPEGPLE